MKNLEKSKDELIKDLAELHQEHENLKALYKKVVSDKKRVNENILMKEKILGAVIEQTPIAIAVFDLQMNYLSYSPQYLIDYKLGEQNLTGQSHYKIFPEIPVRWKEIHNRCLKGESVKCEEDTFEWANGTIEWLKWEINPWYKSRDKVGGIVLSSQIISESKKTAKALMEIKTRFKTMFEVAPLGIALIDSISGKILEVNPMFAKIVGRTVEEMTRIDWLSITHPDDIQEYHDNMALLVKGEINGFQMEKRYLKPDGSIVWVNMIISRLIVELNKPLMHICMTEDISGRKNLEKTLLLKSKIVENIAEGVVLSRIADNRIVYANPTLENMLGYEPDELIGQHISILNAPTERSPMEIADDITKALNHNGYWSGEIQNINKNGELIWSRAIVSAFEHGDLGGVWISVHENITGRKISEKLLYDSEERYGLVISATEEGIFDSDFVAKTTYLSPRWLEIMGYTEDEIRQNQEDKIKIWISKIHPEDVENVLANRKDYLDGIKPYNVEYRIIKGNEIRWIRSTGKTIYSENGIPTRFVGSILDITDRKRAEYELILAKEKAQESDRLKSAFLANMSHEIRTPMNGILGFAELLREPKLSDEEQQEYIQIIKNSGTRMLNIINDLIDISKIESGQIKVNLQSSNINDQLEYIYTFFKPEVEQKGMQLVMKENLSSSDSIIITDQEKVFAILTNLVKNAIKYSDTGTIEFGYEKIGPKLVFFVKDQGKGIGKDKQAAIFDRFYQINMSHTRSSQGAGLGLAIAKSYVEMLGGKIWVESDEGQGSVFYFTLPYKTERGEIEGGNFILNDDIENQDKKLVILIVEDDYPSEYLISISIKELAKVVLIARTGLDAVAICRRNPDIDLILMDIQLPEMNGYEAVNEIRKFNQKVIIIAQTAYGLIGDREKALDAGCNDYLAKPIYLDTLREIIKMYYNN